MRIVGALAAIASLLIGAPGTARAEIRAPSAGSPAADPSRFFETSVRPLLAERCWKCHGPAVQQAGLRLDSAAAIRRGGAHGPALVPRDPAGSRLLRAVRHEAGVRPMPPGERLSEREIAALEAWIRMGAPWPETAPRRADADRGVHWAFRPVRRPPVPAVRNRAWVRTPVDAFILARLEARGLRPAPPADRRTLIRRVTYDLTGLPPTPEEVEAFVRDPSPDAWEKVVNRLLASPHYGERWGRHWLDVARYADSNGLDENVHYGNAWRYRDYVIAAFNRDKPYDRFLIEQIAGDLLPPDPNPEVNRERLIATGFLAIGPKFISEVDTEKVLMDLVDEQVDTLGRTVMGLTLGCARCHDHKYDPISQRDYYALAGIFRSTRTLEVLKKPRMWFEHSLATEADLSRHRAHQARLEEQQQKIAALLEQARQELAAANPGRPLPKNIEGMLPANQQAELKRLRDELTRLEQEAPELPAAMGVTEGEIADLRIHRRGSHLDLGEPVRRGFPVVLAGSAQPILDSRRSGRLELARWLASPSHPLTGRVIVNRVWRWHFGRGIVLSTDNFGRLGERPTHPELLDFLAAVFTAPAGVQWSAGPHGEWLPADRRADSALRWEGCGWSFKRLHRLILLSNSYRMSSAYDPRAAARDPENRLFWRAAVRRLEAEEIRDAILAVSGLLDPTMGGKSLPLKNREYLFDHTSRDQTRYDSRRRSVYLPVVRNHLYDVFQLFDFGDGAVAEGNRPTTTVAPQALFFLNSDLVIDAAEALAAGLLREPLPPGERIRRLYLRLYSRPPSAREARWAEALLRRFAEEASRSESEPSRRELRAWSWLAHTLLAANEFVYLR